MVQIANTGIMFKVAMEDMEVMEVMEAMDIVIEITKHKLIQNNTSKN